MKELYIKYPSLQIMHLTLLFALSARDSVNMDDIYKKYKELVFVMGLDNYEYDLCIKWFCDTMEY